MNKRLLSVFVFALVVSGVASLILYRFISRQIGSSAAPTGTPIVVATRNLEVGAMLREDDLKVETWTGPAPPGSIIKIDDAKNRGLVYPIFSGEPVLESHLAAPGAGAGLAAIIPKGLRAVAVRVNEVVGVSGFATPGAHVDVLVSGTPPGGAGHTGTLSKTLLQDIEVLSAGQNIQKDAEGKPVSVPVVNLLVTPEQAEILSLANSDARIQLVLRNPIDRDVTHTKGTAMAYLFEGGVPPVAVVPPPAPAPPPKVRVARPVPPPPTPRVEPPPPPQVVVVPITVEMIHGSKRTESKFPGEEVKPEPKPEPAVPVDAKVKGGGL